MNTPKITSRPGPRITPNIDYGDDGRPIPSFSIPFKASLSLVEAFSDADSNVKIIPNGNIAIGDV